MRLLKSFIKSLVKSSPERGPAHELSTRKPLQIIVDLNQIEKRSEKTLSELAKAGIYLGPLEEMLSSFLEDDGARPQIRLGMLEHSMGGEYQFYLDLSPLCFLKFDPLVGYNAVYVTQMDSVDSSRIARLARFSDFQGYFVESSICWHLTRDPRPFDIQCHVCSGKSRISCRKCDGKGKFHGKCNKCEGKGKVECPYCKGQGVTRCRSIRRNNQTILALPEAQRGTQPIIQICGIEIPRGEPRLLTKAKKLYGEQSKQLSRRADLRKRERNLHDRLGTMRRFLNTQRLVELDDAESAKVRFSEVLKKSSNEVLVDYKTFGKQHLAWSSGQRLVFLEDVDARPLRVKIRSIKESAIELAFGGNTSLRAIPLKGELATKSTVRAIEVQQRGISRWFSKSILRSPIKEQLASPNIEFNNHNPKSLKFFDQLVGENAEQSRAVSMALDKNVPISLIQGPPGTGKTRVIVEIVRQILSKSTSRILISSQSNLAVDNVLERLRELDEHFIVRVGNPLKIQSSLHSCSIESQAASLVERLGSHLISSSRSVDAQYQHLARLVGDNGLLSQFESLPREAISEREEIAREILQVCKVCEIEVEDIFRESGRIGDLAVSKISKLEMRRSLFSDWKQYVSSSLSEPRDLVAPFAQVVGATCVGSGGRFLETLRSLDEDEMPFDLVIVDEAGRSTAMETLVPMGLAKRTVLVGDHKQLPPLISNEARNLWLSREGDEGKSYLPGELSLFEQLLGEFPKNYLTILNRQYRMHPTIADFVSEAFYSEEKLESGVTKEDKTLPLEGFPEALSYHPTEIFGADRFEQTHKQSKSKYNPLEVELVSSILSLLDEANYPSAPSVGVISFYSAQVALLKERVKTLGLKNLDMTESDSIATLDSFQGKERDVIILSLVRSPENTSRVDASWFKFFLDVRRLNVALSRAKQRLFVVGDIEGLLSVSRGKEEVEGFSVLRKFHSYLKNNDCVVPLVLDYEQ